MTGELTVQAQIDHGSDVTYRLQQGMLHHQQNARRLNNLCISMNAEINRLKTERCHEYEARDLKLTREDIVQRNVSPERIKKIEDFMNYEYRPSDFSGLSQELQDKIHEITVMRLEDSEQYYTALLRTQFDRADKIIVGKGIRRPNDLIGFHRDRTKPSQWDATNMSYFLNMDMRRFIDTHLPNTMSFGWSQTLSIIGELEIDHIVSCASGSHFREPSYVACMESMMNFSNLARTGRLLNRVKGSKTLLNRFKVYDDEGCLQQYVTVSISL